MELDYYDGSDWCVRMI